MPVHRRVIPSIKFADTHLYTRVERGTVSVKCLAQEHNTMSLARAQTRTTQSGDECINHEATTLHTLSCKLHKIYQEDEKDKRLGSQKSDNDIIVWFQISCYL